MNERELIAKAKTGDYEAFMELLDTHKGKVYGMICRMTGNNQDAEDIMQDTVLRAIDKIDKFREESSFGTWLYTIALNMTRSQFAKSKQANLKPIEEYLPDGKLNAAHHNSGNELFDWKDPHEILETRQLKTIINGAVGELPFKYREVFMLRYVEELPVKEIAKLTRQSEASAKSRILRARLAVRNKLSTIFEDMYGSKVS